MNITATLSINPNVPKSEYKMGEKIELSFSIRNKGNANVPVNSRNGVGYQNSLDREIYCTLQKDGEEYTGFDAHRIDYRRKRLQKDDFSILAPGDSIEGRFVLNEWYHLDGPGDYLVTVHYSPEKDEANPFEPELAGVASSFLITIVQ